MIRMKLRHVAGVLLGLVVLASPATAGAPPLAKRVTQLQRTVRTLTRLAVSTNNQVHKLQRAPVGTTDVTFVQTPAATDSTGTAHGTAQCPEGRVATGGGAVFQQTTNTDRLVFSHPYVTAGVPTGWEAAAVKGAGGGSLLVEVVCALAP